MTEDMIRMAQQPREPRSIMSSQSLEHLMRQLIRLCDEVEQHGLVDYQMGVAEEEIVECKPGTGLQSPRTKADNMHSIVTMSLLTRSSTRKK